MSKTYLALRCWLFAVGTFIGMLLSTHPYSFVCFLVSMIGNVWLAISYEREMKRGYT